MQRAHSDLAIGAKSIISHAFWEIFFEQHCQRPNDDMRLFPVDKTYPDIYKEYFTPWYNRLCSSGKYSEADRPRFQTWRNARDAEEFKDVKNRRQHLHSRCGECARLKTLLLKSFADGHQERLYQQQRRLHDEEVTQWRKLEEVLKAQAVSSPDSGLLICHDGTQALLLPRFTHRTIKNLDHTRFEVTPWLAMDYSAGLKDYIYSTTANTPKDANTLITQLHLVVRRAKSDYKHPRHRARKMTVIADSASENKNNILLCYCQDLVDNGWFDEIQLLFGPVGHTHNGVDASHKVHNQNVGGYVSGDLGQFVQNYIKGFNGSNSEGHQQPNASILGATLNWTAYYEPSVRRVVGFTKSKKDPVMVRGFRIMKQINGTVDVTWKVDPALETAWRGSSGFPNTAGFYMLRCAPRGLPKHVVRPQPSTSHMVSAKKLLATNMRSAMTNEGLQPCIDWNYKAMCEQVVPVHRYLEDTVPDGEWGRLCEIGAMDGKRGKVRMIDTFWDSSLPKTRTTLWKLPFSEDGCHKDATENAYHNSGDQSLLDSRPLPRFRYEDEKKSECEVAHHPNVGGQGWVQDEEEDEGDGGEGESEEEKEVDGEENVEGREAAEQDAQPQRDTVWRFEEDFKECKKGSFCVGLAETKEGPSPYIFVGKIKSFDKDTKELTLKPYKCNVDPWSKNCIDKMWNRPPNPKDEKRPHYAVISYVPRLLDRGNLPKKAKDNVAKRNIVWCS